MPITVVWDNSAHTVIRLDYRLPIASWEEYRAAARETAALANTVPHAVSVIHNAGGVPMPAGSPFPHVQYAAGVMPPNVGMIVAVVSNRFVQTLLPIILRPLVKNFTFAASLDDARHMLAAPEPQR